MSRFTPSTVKSTVSNVVPNVMITPKMAEVFLKNNSGNRPLKFTSVTLYAKVMKAALWRPNVGTPIMFFADGSLANGQNRLKAIVQTGVAQIFVVHYGCTKEDVAAVDRGCPRTEGDIFQMLTGIPNGRNVVSVVKTLINWGSGRARGMGGTHGLSDMSDLVDVGVLHHPGFAPFITAGWGHTRKDGCGSTAVNQAVQYIIHQADPIKAADFFTQLKSGAGLPAKSPILTLREALAKEALKTAKGDKKDPSEDANTRALWIFAAWKCYLTKKTFDPKKVDVTTFHVEGLATDWFTNPK